MNHVLTNAVFVNVLKRKKTFFVDISIFHAIPNQQRAYFPWSCEELIFFYNRPFLRLFGFTDLLRK